MYYAWILCFCGFCVGKGLVFWLLGGFWGVLRHFFCKRQHKWFLLGVWRLVYLVGYGVGNRGKRLGKSVFWWNFGWVVDGGGWLF